MSEPLRRPYPAWLDLLPDETKEEAIEAFNNRYSTDIQPVIDNQITVVVPQQAPPPLITEEETE